MKITLIIKHLLLPLTLLLAIPNISFAVTHTMFSTSSTIDNGEILDSTANAKDIEKNEPAAQKKWVSITIDDLPFVGESRNFHLNMMIDTMTKQQVAATGFIIASEVHKDNWGTLQKFRDAGFGLGNHTLTHANLNKLRPHEYQYEIQQADKILSSVLTEPKYFRYPYLSMSSGQKKEDILCYLAQKNYRVAPITVDSKDFVFNQRLLSVPEMNRRAYLEELKPFYLDFIWQQTLRAEEHNQYHRNTTQAQILLIHANLLNAYVLPDIINLYKQNGYDFVTLEDALKTFKYPVQCSKPMIHAKRQVLRQEPDESDSDIEAFIDWD